MILVESSPRSATPLLNHNAKNDRRMSRQSWDLRWRVLGILLWCPLFLAPQATASGPDADRPIKQMRHSSWNEASGLSGVVYSLAQTSDGFLWIGTSTGLYRFDGLKFEPFLENAEDHPISEVRTLLATSDGGLWIGHRNGVAFLKQDKASFYAEQQGLPYGRATNLAQTQDGAIWAAVTLSGGGKAEGGKNSLAGLARFSNGSWEKIGTDWKYPANSTEKIIVDGAGTLWATGGESVYFLPRGSQIFQQADVKVSSWTEICTGPDGSVWIADSITHTLFNFRKSPEVGHSSVTAEPLQDINEIRFDGAHSLWLATGRGLYRIPFGAISALPKQTNSETEKDQFMLADGMSGREVNTVLEDREGNVWVGTTNGLDRFSDRSVTQFNVGHTPTDLIAGPHSEVWASQFGASPYLIPLHDCNPFLLRTWYTRSFHMDRTGTLWAAMQSDSTWESRGLWKDQNGKVTKIESPPEMKGPLIDGIVSDAAGRLWMTIRSYGEYTFQDGKWERFPVFSGNDLNISPDAQFVDALGRAWLVYYARSTVVMIDGAKRVFFTAEHGLDLGNPIVGWASGTQIWVSGTKGLGYFDGESFRNIRASDDSLFKNVSAIIPTEHDGLWLKGPEGVIQIPQDELLNLFRDHAYAVRYRVFDGATDFVAQLARYKPATSGTDAVRSGDGKLWFSVSTGVAMIDPAHLAKNDLPPPVVIRSLTADGRVYSTYSRLILPKSTHEVSLDYTALSLNLSERNRFRYQLVGVDKEWKDVGTRRQAFYTNLAPGTYTFNVVAANNDGVWNETGASISFKIPPTFLQAIWFKIILVVVAAFLVWVLYVLRLRKATAEVTDRLGVRLQERERIARELHDTLLQDFQAMILRFHIISRRFTSGDPNRVAMDEGLLYADKVLAEGRNRIRDIRADAKAPQDLAKAFGEYGNQLSLSRPVAFDVKVTGSQLELDPIVRDEIYRIGREAIGNAFKHSECSKIEVELAYAARGFQMRVRDDGKGIEPAILTAGGKPGHWGIYNMVERAQKIGASLEFSSQLDGGTTLELRLPLRSFRRSLASWFT
jgi:signal transduction histidine kinase/ligand-binding sensor domain-containing protein